MGGPWVEQLAWLTPWQPDVVSEVVQGVAPSGVLALYFWIVFGQLSRRFERQADVFGSKVVSCDLADCPPHNDLDHDLAPDRFAVGNPTSARWGSGYSPTPSPMSRGATGWTRTVDRGGTEVSPTGSRFWKDSNGIPSAKASSSVAFTGCASDLALFWPWRSCSRSSRSSANRPIETRRARPCPIGRKSLSFHGTGSTIDVSSA